MQRKGRSGNIRNAPCSEPSVVGTAAQGPPNSKKACPTVCQSTAEAPGDTRPESTTASKLNDQASMSSGAQEEDKAGSSNRFESLSQSQADKKPAVQKSRKASRKEQYDKCVSNAQVKHHKALSKKADAEPLHHQNSYQQVTLKCKKIAIGTLQRTAKDLVTLSVNDIKINQGKDAEGIRLKTTEFTKCTYGFVHNIFVTFLKITAAAYQKLESQIKWDRNEGNVQNQCNVTNPEEHEVILISEMHRDSDINTVVEAIMTTIGVRNNIPDFCTKITSKKVISVLAAFRKSIEDTSSDSRTKHTVESEKELQHEIPCEVLDSDESESFTPEGIAYPPPPAKAAIVMTEDDIKCLNEGEYLNDTIIDFYLKYLELEKLKKEDAERTHVFSSLFYTSLTVKERRNLQETPELTTQQQRHKRVESWTRHVDVFEKDFIFVPIVEDVHWVLAVICFPGLEKPEYKDNPHAKKTRASNLCKQPCILLMDSLKTSCPPRIFQILQEWLEVEWEVKKGSKRSFSKNAMRCFSLDVPQQNNAVDCGIFVLQYAESFFESPILSFDRPVNLTDWFPYSRVEKKREEIQNIILRLK